jgi:hypothetical protein
MKFFGPPATEVIASKPAPASITVVSSGAAVAESSALDAKSDPSLGDNIELF